MDRAKLKEQLIVDEGNRKRIYVDTVGKVSGGVGRNLTDKGFRPDEIDLMLSNDIDEVIDDLDRMLPWWRRMSDARQNVLANMSFNMGLPTLLTFKNTLRAMQEGKYSEASDLMMQSKWAKQVGARAVRLSDVMLKGEF